MLLKKIKFLSTLLLAIPLISYSGVSIAGDDDASSDFLIRLFNAISFNQPVHYIVTSKGQAPVEGQLSAKDEGDGKVIKIVSAIGEARAEIVLTDLKGHILWDGTVAYDTRGPQFCTKTITLDPHYNVEIQSFAIIHTISIDIRSKS